MSEPSLVDRLLECGCRPDAKEVCDLCQVIKPEVERLRAKLQAAEAAIKEMSGAQFGLYHNRLRDGSGKCGEPCGVCRAEAAEAEVADHMAGESRLLELANFWQEKANNLQAEVARLKDSATCSCGDVFNAGFKGVCPNCLAGEDSELRARIAALEAGLRRLRDCDWVITPADRMDAVRDIARTALASAHPGDREPSNTTPERP